MYMYCWSWYSASVFSIFTYHVLFFKYILIHLHSIAQCLHYSYPYVYIYNIYTFSVHIDRYYGKSCVFFQPGLARLQGATRTPRIPPSTQTTNTVVFSGNLLATPIFLEDYPKLIQVSWNVVGPPGRFFWNHTLSQGDSRLYKSMRKRLLAL